MTLDPFVKAIYDVTTVYRKGEVVERRRIGNIESVDVYGYEHTDDADTAEEIVDLVFVNVGVKREAKDRSAEFLSYLVDWHSPTLVTGPSYIHTGAELGDQELALRLFAILTVLGFATLMTPDKLGFEGEEVRKMAGNGFLYAILTPEAAEAVRSGQESAAEKENEAESMAEYRAQG